ncbi:MAG: alpha-glucosidase [Lachnospiraceae bacterium]|nr:alpha-glucosidase [Lachnospiraceae bacterium]
MIKSYKYNFGYPMINGSVPMDNFELIDKTIYLKAIEDLGEKYEPYITIENFEKVNEDYIKYTGEKYTEDSKRISLKIKIDIQNNTRIYGMGESLGSVNKRGRIYRSFCSDDPHHYEDKVSLYGAHNFFVYSLEEDVSTDALCTFCDDPLWYDPMYFPNATYGIFIDYPGALTLDMGFSERNEIIIDFEIEASKVDFSMIIIKSNKKKDYEKVIKTFREIIGKSYVPPKWGFGYGQSRWGYRDEADIRAVRDGYKKHNIPLSMIYMDIDYMEDYKDFTVSSERFPDFKSFVESMKDDGIKLIPIIDAAIKVEEGYEVYEEGKEKGYFCRDKKGNDFIGAVWPGRSVFPNFLDYEVRQWFGDKYKYLIDAGIEGFWNDMNEPAIFYSEEGLKKAFDKLDSFREKNIGINEYFELMGTLNGISNSDDDYKSIYHRMEKSYLNHYEFHNLYGYNMTRAASDSFKKNYPDKEFLLFSRSSYIGAHRYGGIWQGDNKSIWSHLKMNFQMMPGLNMCGFLYTGADIGGFGANVNDELMLRWLAVGIFTPLFRNHSALGTKNQELYNLNYISKMRFFINLRYRLLPFLYDEYMKAADEDSLMFRPLEFAFPKDPLATEIEDQLMLGKKVMLAPVFSANQTGRVVYFPIRMKVVRFKKCSEYSYLDRASDNSSDDFNNDSNFFIGKDFEVLKGEKLPTKEELKAFGITEEMYKFITKEKIEIETFTLKKGYNYISVPLDSVVVFVR